jgi:hypothetical protein
MSACLVAGKCSSGGRALAGLGCADPGGPARCRWNHTLFTYNFSSPGQEFYNIWVNNGTTPYSPPPPPIAPPPRNVTCERSSRGAAALRPAGLLA